MSLSLSCWTHCTYLIMLGFSIDQVEWLYRLGWTDRFNRLFDDIPRNDNIACLAYSMDAVNSLGLDHWVPMRLYQMHAASNGEINTKYSSVCCCQMWVDSCIIYPSPALPIVASITVHLGFWLNSFIAWLLPSRLVFPSIRWKQNPLDLIAIWIKSSILV